MDESTTMTVPPPLPVKTQGRDASQAARQTVSIRTVSPSAAPPLASGPGATVFVGVSAPTADSTTTCRRRIPEVQSANGYEERSSVVESSLQQRWQQHHHQQQAAHIVKIKINPDGDKNGRVISTVRLTLDENGIARERSDRRGDGAVVVSATNLVNERHCESAGAGEGCVRISVFGGEATSDNRERDSNSSIDNNNDEEDDDRRGLNNDRSDNKDMVHRETTETLNSSSLGGRPNACFYYNSYQSPLNGMVMSSGQCSPSDTLDSGTCSDLDGTPPPLPKKKNSSMVILSNNTHNRTGSLTSSGAEVDSDDNESNISCDSLNGAEVNGEYRVHSTSKDLVTKDAVEEKAVADVVEKSDVRVASTNDDRQVEKSSGVRQQVSAVTELGSAPCSPVSSASVSPSPSGTSSLSKASSTPRVRSPDPAIELNGKPLSPVIKERTYEERKQREQERIEQECADVGQNQSTGHKYLYEDDRYYNFHVNELRGNNNNSNGEHGVAEKEECFAGYKIHDKEAIRSAKGTVRGVKNRVRAGIATFLQTPSSKAYVEREKGRVVLYTTSLGIVRETFTNCMKMKQMLWTNMVKYEEADLFRDTELQTELRDRTDSEVVTLPQLFVDGQHIGGVDTVERLNESGELRRILEPYQCKDACVVCTYCGGFQRLLCPVCHGSKRSVHRNEFTVEFVALKCAKCDVFGMIRCPHC
ncbi:glutaredoxin domain-containing cysteine-rich protein CG31559-like [Odontomachus brunneus]|uniref:glutaredoxin domain-containing cysteine-rich protein CG31559-like n=1 Tax=Odontomachus brunneus TaxID=486640 RepID=UPI0013F2A4D9|nr:glutaredoxin domain-containing cysteine-rich protein CG31559-like [Odontomachus brunneus]XP_032665616.1 glutaredoxin domain-containing cysteine-rich protein CG31559-like [Odontomachus brunneus]XP_032665626.1 glutaredoxin domain-containing cysteine-rich protein CG31559-like [Odontomachus brunneus]XP_032665634.1 glutaredoxin domain-containing cysteine-rich protein CG31559-like [Odontomachus brunneus]XP_032665641.1 glutaredoxin domain-containing cysteine-rich protein CG31559-like [Odontomachus 